MWIGLIIIMNYRTILYIIVVPLVIWAMDSVRINEIFKKNKVVQARVFTLLIVLGLSFLVVNFICDFFLSYKFI